MRIAKPATVQLLAFFSTRLAENEGVSDELGKTWQLLTKSRNRAVLALLRAGLRSSSAEVRAEAIRCGVGRHDVESHRQLIGCFHKLRPEERALLCESHAAMPHHMAAALRMALLGGDAGICASAYQIIKRSRDFNLFPTLVQAATNGKHAVGATASDAMMHLAGVLREELVRWVASEEPPGRDPTFHRRNVLVALERSLNEFEKHQCRAVLDAFMTVAPSDNSILLRILRDSQHACHHPLIATLSTSASRVVIDRLAELAHDAWAPPAALIAIANRADRAFLEQFLNSLKRPVSLRVLENMKRLRRVAWLEEHREMLLELSSHAQAAAVELAMASGLPEDSKFDLLALLLKDGLAEARRISCSALTSSGRPDATDLVMEALNDPDDTVRAAAIRQLRPRGVPDALKLLVEFIDTHSLEIRDAARSALAEFNFLRYRAMFHLLDASSARTTGQLVYKVDPSARQGLVEELTSPSASIKLRGIEMVLAMGAVDDLCGELIALAEHENPALRREALAALGECSSDAVESVLRLATEDPHDSIRDTAKEALARWSGSKGIVFREPAAASGNRR